MEEVWEAEEEEEEEAWERGATQHVSLALVGCWAPPSERSRWGLGGSQEGDMYLVWDQDPWSRFLLLSAAYLAATLVELNSNV